MDLARDQIRQGSDAGAGARVLRQQRRLRMLLVQILDDRERLVEARTVVELERRHQCLRVDLHICGLAVLAFGKVHEHRLVGEAFEIERDAYAERRGAAEIGVQLHKAGSIFTLSSPTPSMPACSSSPGFTGPTPAGVPE